MPATRKYQTIVINNKTRYCCPDCDKTFKTDASVSGHWCKFHKTVDTATDNNNKNKPTIVIPDTQPLRSAKTTMVTRKEFDELNAKYQIIIEQNQTIIEMLKNMTSVSKPVVDTCEISTQTEEPVEVVVSVEVQEQVEVIEKVEEHVEVAEQVMKQPKAKATPKPQKKKETKYEKELNNLQSHPYFSHTTEDGKDIFRCMYGECDSAERLLMFYKMERAKVENRTKWTMYLMEDKMTEEEVDEEWKADKIKIQQDSSNFAKFEAIYDRLKKAKKPSDNKQKKQSPKQVKQPELLEEPQAIQEVEVEQEPIEQPIEQPLLEEEPSELPDKTKFLLECCRTIRNDGFANAYHFLNDPSQLCIMKQEVADGMVEVYDVTSNTYIKKPYMVKSYHMCKGKKTTRATLSSIREELEDIYDTLCETWEEYRMSYNFDPKDCDKFDDEKDWLDVCQYLVHAENIDMFCK